MSHRRAPLIDTHAHFVTAEYVAAAQAAGFDVPDQMPAWPTWSPNEHLALMDTCGIDRSILSISSPGVYFGDIDDAIDLARNVNDSASSIQREHPTRFGFFAALPLPDVDAALVEAVRALDRLDAAGFCLMSNVGGLYLGHSSLEPLWQLLAERQAVVFIHPTAPPNVREVSPSRPFPMIEFIFDEARTVVDLLFADVLTRHPDIHFVISHSGGAIPVLMERIDLFYGNTAVAGTPDRTGRLPALLSGLWFDCAGTPLPHALPALSKAVGRERLLFGSDYCFTSPAGVTEHVRQLGADAQPWLESMVSAGQRLLPDRQQPTSLNALEVRP